MVSSPCHVFSHSTRSLTAVLGALATISATFTSLLADEATAQGGQTRLEASAAAATATAGRVMLPPRWRALLVLHRRRALLITLRRSVALRRSVSLRLAVTLGRSVAVIYCQRITLTCRMVYVLCGLRLIGIIATLLAAVVSLIAHVGKV